MFTQTIPAPPPGAGLLVDTAAFVVCMADEGVAIGGVAETGDVAAVGAVFFALNHECLAGAGDVATGDGAGGVVASCFLECLRFATVGEASGLEVGVAAGDEAVATVASFFLECLCFATVGDASGLEAGVGVWANNAAAENAANTINRRKNLFMVYDHNGCRGINATPKKLFWMRRAGLCFSNRGLARLRIAITTAGLRRRRLSFWRTEFQPRRRSRGLVCWRNADGSLNAKTVKLDPPTPKEKAKKAAGGK